MYKLVIYCKSYLPDLNRALALAKSIDTFNVDSIPFYMSVPDSDYEEFKSKLPNSVNLIKDSDITKEDNQGWLGQQVVKSQFWRLNLCDNYLCIDSDCVFIRPFRVSDFMFDDETPYTICHEYKSFFEFMDKHPMPFDPYESFKKERLHIMDLFNREGVIYDFGPAPVIWSKKVWQSLDDNYLKPNGLTFTDMLNANGSEFTWYGEWLLRSQVIRLMPRGPLFKNYHYPIQYDYDKHYGYGIDKLSKLYMGIGLQSIYEFN